MTIEDALKTSEVTVKFTKADGSERTMRCTQEPQKIADIVGIVENTGVAKRVSDDVFKVFDLDISAWRSFRKDSVIDWSV